MNLAGFFVGSFLSAGLKKNRPRGSSKNPIAADGKDPEVAASRCECICLQISGRRLRPETKL